LDQPSATDGDCALAGTKERITSAKTINVRRIIFMTNVAAHFKLRLPLVNNLSSSIASVNFQAPGSVAPNRNWFLDSSIFVLLISIGSRRLTLHSIRRFQLHGKMSSTFAPNESNIERRAAGNDIWRIASV
jgi:hypothetical protein